MKLSTAACSSTLLFLFKSYVTAKISLLQRLLCRGVDYLGFSRWAFFRGCPQYLKNLPRRKEGNAWHAEPVQRACLSRIQSLHKALQKLFDPGSQCLSSIRSGSFFFCVCV
uniref:Putative secreted protein n=1 Tax=Ixodes ricinus TaxID=34613 RepID=A0A147BBW0_IXORI